MPRLSSKLGYCINIFSSLGDAGYDAVPSALEGNPSTFSVASLFGSSYGRGLLLNSLAFLLCTFSFLHGDAQSRSQCMSANVRHDRLYKYRLYKVEAFFCRLPSIVYLKLVFDCSIFCWVEALFCRLPRNEIWLLFWPGCLQ